MEIKTEEKLAKDLTRAEFVSKASECIHNFLWKCKHPKQLGKACEKLCEYYENHIK
jgi:hypothetical protein